ncbi:MAG TPA: HAMP domain-containing sensor histidine kinase [Anaerolineaceae bacterium]|nr:HAMP domain-containing sensor histidine kinase [Anaerolineaceae bacterium]
MNRKTQEENKSRNFIFAGGIIIVFIISLVIFYWLMRPPMEDLEHMAQFLSFTTVISIGVGYGAYRLNWLERAPSLRWVLLGTYVLASFLTFLNVWLTARLMFASEHDLLLATVLLLFAGGIAVVLGSFFTSTLIARIKRLESAAKSIESGNLSARADIPGNDEIAALAKSFNQMAQKIQTADQKQKELESLRRDLVTWAGHDLRTPLSSIRLLVEALSDGVVTDPVLIQNYLSQTKKHVNNLSLLIDDLFQISQLDAGGIPLTLEPSSLSDLISDTLESFSGLANQRGIILSGSAEKDVDPIFIDVLWLGRAINNLVSNAIRHTSANGSVTGCAESVGENILVSVRDTGEGINPQDLPHVFERFYRGEKSRNLSGGGAGLGLAIAKGIVEAHKGNISVESTPGQETTFTFSLPKR